MLPLSELIGLQVEAIAWFEGLLRDGLDSQDEREDGVGGGQKDPFCRGGTPPSCA